jgi:hypothetical protein
MNGRTALSKTSEKKGKESAAAKPKENLSQSNEAPVEQILHLQETLGNQAVQRLIKKGTLQAKLKIGQPNDKYEQEADRIADRVMSMPEPKRSLVTGHSSSVQRESTCPECEEKEGIQTKPLVEQTTPLVQRQVEEEEPVQAKQAPNQAPAVTSNIESSVNSLKGGGQPLPESTRSYFEPRFGADFRQVRVHTDSHAAETAKSINAKAFTKGKDVVFGTGQYSPGTSSGKRLLAHELTHTLQQQYGSRYRIQRNPSFTTDAAKVVEDPNPNLKYLKPAKLKNILPPLLRKNKKRSSKVYKKLIEGLIAGGIPIDKWAYLIAASERENFGREVEHTHNVFNVFEWNLFESIRLKPKILKRKGVTQWMAKVLKIIGINTTVENVYNKLKSRRKNARWNVVIGSYKNQKGQTKHLTFLGLFRKIKSMISPKRTVEKLATTPKFQRYKALKPKGIGIAANLLFAYISNQLFYTFTTGFIKSYGRRAMEPMKNARRKIYLVLRRLNRLVPQKQVRSKVRKYLNIAKGHLLNGIKKVKQKQPELPVARKYMDTAKKNINHAIALLKNRWLKKKLRSAKQALSGAANLQSFKERAASLSRKPGEIEAVVYIASTGNEEKIKPEWKKKRFVPKPQWSERKKKIEKEKWKKREYKKYVKRWMAKSLTISGIAEARVLFTHGTTKWKKSQRLKVKGKFRRFKGPVLSQYRRFKKRFIEIREIMKRLALAAKKRATSRSLKRVKRVK